MHSENVDLGWPPGLLSHPNPQHVGSPKGQHLCAGVLLVPVVPVLWWWYLDPHRVRDPHLALFSPSVCARLPVEVVMEWDSLVTVARGAGEREGFQDEGRERGWGEWRWRAGAESFPGALEVGPCVS